MNIENILNKELKKNFSKYIHIKFLKYGPNKHSIFDESENEGWEMNICPITIFESWMKTYYLNMLSKNFARKIENSGKKYKNMIPWKIDINANFVKYAPYIRSTKPYYVTIDEFAEMKKLFDFMKNESYDYVLSPFWFSSYLINLGRIEMKKIHRDIINFIGNMENTNIDFINNPFLNENEIIFGNTKKYTMEFFIEKNTKSQSYIYSRIKENTNVQDFIHMINEDSYRYKKGDWSKNSFIRDRKIKSLIDDNNNI